MNNRELYKQRDVIVFPVQMWIRSEAQICILISPPTWPSSGTQDRVEGESPGSFRRNVVVKLFAKPSNHRCPRVQICSSEGKFIQGRQDFQETDGNCPPGKL